MTLASAIVLSLILYFENAPNLRAFALHVKTSLLYLKVPPLAEVLVFSFTNLTKSV